MCLLIAGGVFAEDFGTNGTKLTYEVQLTTEVTVENRTDFPMYFATGNWVKYNNGGGDFCPVQLFYVKSNEICKITMAAKGLDLAHLGFTYDPMEYYNFPNIINKHIIIKNVTDKERKLCENAENGYYSTNDYGIFIYSIATTDESQPQQILFVRCFNNFDYLLLLDRMK